MIGSDTVLGFFEAIVNDDKFHIVESKFYNRFHDSLHFRNVKINREKGEIKYNAVEPNTRGLEINTEQTIETLSDHINQWISSAFNNTIKEIDEYVENHSNDNVETFIKLQISKIEKIQGNLEGSVVIKCVPFFNDYILKIKNHLTNIAEIYGFAVTKNDYGIHQKNKDWIVQKFNEEILEKPSQNQAVISVKEKYHNKFGLNIGKTTILRFNDRAE